MAKQIGPLKITGTLYGITFYKMGEAYYARSKSSLDSKRVKRDPAFKRTMEEASLFGLASKTAAKLKTGLTREERKKIHHGRLTARVKCLLVEGKTTEEIFALLRPELIPVVISPIITPPEAPEEKDVYAEKVIRQALMDTTKRMDKFIGMERVVNSPGPLTDAWLDSG